MLSSLVLVVGVVSCVLAVPAPILAPPGPPCVPKYNTPGLSQEYSTIPLGPGMHYCDGSSNSKISSLSAPPSIPFSSPTQPQNPTPNNSGTGNNDDEGEDDCDGNGDDDDTNSTPLATGTNAAMPAGPTTSTQPQTGGSPPAGGNPPAGANPPAGGNPPAATGESPPGATGGSPSTGGNNVTAPASGGSSNGTGAASGQTYSATITGYGGNCGGQAGACGFLGSQGSYQGAVSNYWNGAGLPGQCGTCWQIHDGQKIDGNKKPAGPIGTDPIVVMIDNTCAPDPSKPTGANGGFQCNQNAQNPVDGFGSVTVVDLCADTGASDAFFGAAGTASPGEDNHKAGLAIAKITQVDCGAAWKGSIGLTTSWTKYQASPGSKLAASVKPGH